MLSSNFPRPQRPTRARTLIVLTVMLITLAVGLTIRTAQADPVYVTIYVDADNVSGVEDGTLAHPFRTISRALNEVSTGATVLVYPGTYLENISLNGMPPFTLKSLAGPEVTIIDGRNLDSVIALYQGDVTIEGFTLQNGGGSSSSVSSGYGIAIDAGTVHATIRHNIIKQTHLRAGIGLIDGGQVEILIENNLILFNTASDIYNTGGIHVEVLGGVTGWCLIRNNIIAHNQGYAGGITLITTPGLDLDVINNTIISNTGTYGGGIRLGVASARLANNIMALNRATFGSGSFVDSDLYGTPAGAVIEYNDIGDGQLAGTNGNISAPPLFADLAHDDFHLTTASPCVNAGTAAGAPPTDFEGDVRPFGSGIDLGADELIWAPDGLPPQSSAASPVFADLVFGVSWQGTDGNGSGIDHYDLQVKDGAQGGWTDWLTRTHATQAVYGGEVGHTYYFQSRAVDHAGNVEPYPGGNGDTNTFVGPDLTSSVKRVTLPGGDLVAGSILTYTILIRNATAINASAWLTDTLPDFTHYISDSLISNAEPATYDPNLGQQGTILWRGVVSSTAPVTIAFQVEVLSVEPGVLPIRNTALIDDGWGHRFERLVFAPSHDLYLPLTLKNF